MPWDQQSTPAVKTLPAHRLPWVVLTCCCSCVAPGRMIRIEIPDSFGLSHLRRLFTKVRKQELTQSLQPIRDGLQARSITVTLQAGAARPFVLKRNEVLDNASQEKQSGIVHEYNLEEGIDDGDVEAG